MYDGPTIWIYQTLASNMLLKEWEPLCSPAVLPMLDLIVSCCVSNLHKSNRNAEAVTTYINKEKLASSIGPATRWVMKRRLELIEEALVFLEEQSYFAARSLEKDAEVTLQPIAIQQLNSYHPEDEEGGKRRLDPKAGRAFPSILYTGEGRGGVTRHAFLANRLLWLNMLLGLLDDRPQPITGAYGVASRCGLKTFAEFKEEVGKTSKKSQGDYIDREVKRVIERYDLFSVQAVSEAGQGRRLEDKRVVISCTATMSELWGV